MPVFQYIAKDSAGKDIKGSVEANDVNQVVMDLKNKGFIVVNIEESKDAAQAGEVVKVAKPKKRKKVKVRDLSVMCRQLGTMLKAGLPLIDALDTIANETENLNLSEAVAVMRDDIESGSTFGEAINRHPKIFNMMFRAMIEAGEASGALSQIISKLSEYLKREYGMQKKIASAMMYPKFVAVFFFCIVSIVLLFLIPQFEDIFAMFGKPCANCKDPVAGKSTGILADGSECPECHGKGKIGKLPALTQVLLDISRFCKGNILILLPLIIGGVVGWKQYSASEKGKVRLQKIFIKFPVVGTLMIKSSTARFSMSLSTLLQNGVPLDQALDITGRVSGNIIVAESTESIRENIIQGGGLAEGMSRHEIFPELVVKMVAVGEESGALSEMLADVAEYYDEEVNSIVEGISSIIEPIMIVSLGAAVAVIVLGLYLPIFSMGKQMTNSR